MCPQQGPVLPWGQDQAGLQQHLVSGLAEGTLPGSCRASSGSHSADQQSLPLVLAQRWGAGYVWACVGAGQCPARSARELSPPTRGLGQVGV